MATKIELDRNGVYDIHPILINTMEFVNYCMETE